MPTHTPPHLIVAFASWSGNGWLETATPRAQQNLGRLLCGMKLVQTDAGQANSLSPPHERVLARALGLAAGAKGDAKDGIEGELEDGMEDGLLPWAALEANAVPGRSWAFITPCHWAMGREHATLTDPDALALSAADAHTLLAAMQPYFKTEGITLHCAAPGRWLAEGEVFRCLPTASLDRVMGRNVDAWLPGSKALKLLQNEMQMLLYTHPLNDERSLQRLPTVNSFWLSGTGALAQAVPVRPNITVNRSLAHATFANDAAAHAHAGAALDAGDIAVLLARQAGGETVRLSLCGETRALTFETSAPGPFTRVMNVFRSSHAPALVFQLSK